MLNSPFVLFRDDFSGDEVLFDRAAQDHRG